MADTYTTNLNLTKPEPGAAEDTWGISLNADLDALDAIFSSSGTQINLNPNQVNFADNKKAIFGAGSDLQIYHDGSNSYIKENGTGALNIAGQGNINFTNSAGSETYAQFTADSSVKLYHDNSIKLTTSSSGIDVTGVITTDGLTTTGDINFGDNDKAVFGAGSDLEIYHNANTSFITESGSSNLKIGGENLYLQNTAHNENYLAAIANGAVTLYYNNSAKLDTTSTGIDVTGTITSDGILKDTASSFNYISGGNASNAGANILLYGQSHASAANTTVFRASGSETARIDSSGNFMVGTTDTFPGAGDTNTGISLLPSGSAAFSRNGFRVVSINRNTSDGDILEFRKDGSVVGSVGTLGGDLSIGTGDTGLRFNDGIDTIIPTNISTNAISNNVVILGHPDYRFKDLYLGGTAYVGTSVGIGTDSPTPFLANSKVLEISDDSGVGSELILTNNSAMSADEIVGSLIFKNTDASGTPNHFAGLRARAESTFGRMDLEFYAGRSRMEGGTPDMVITPSGADAQAKVGIGTTPNTNLHVYDASGGATLKIESNTANAYDSSKIQLLGGNLSTSEILLGDASSATTGRIIYRHDGNTLAFDVNGSEAGRFTSTGTFLVGKTADNTTDTGSVVGDGYIYATRSGNIPLVLNRTTSDGTITQFRKDNSTYGTISNSGTNLIISGSGTNKSGLYYGDNALFPVKNGNLSNSTIGFGSPNYRFSNLYLSGTANVNALDITSGSSIHGTITTSSSSLTLNARNTGIMIFQSGGSEKARIDSSGNLLVGTTTVSLYNNSSEVGTRIGDGVLMVNRSANTPAYFNRLSTDGNIVDFRKDGSAVGSIGTVAGYLGIANGDTGFLFRAPYDDILPYSSTANSAIDNTIDLGDPSFRFKDLHLSGNVISDGYFKSGSNVYIGKGSSISGSYGANDIVLDSEAANSKIIFRNLGGSESARIDGSGNFYVGTTDTTLYSATSGGGIYAVPNGSTTIARQSNTSTQPIFILNETGVDGTLQEFRKDGTTIGSIGVASSDNFYIGASASGHAGLYFDNGNMVPMSSNLPADNVIDLGSPLARFDDIYATNATIQTSDRNEKQDIEELSEAETRVAVAAKGLLKKFKFKSAVAEKGDEARIHFGIIAQDLQDAFTAEGLDASDYAMFCSNTWTDDDGVEQTRLGVRYSELLAFIIAAI